MNQFPGRQCVFSNNFPNGHILSHRPTYHVGDMLSFDCQLGYTLLGEITIECMATGSWSAQIPTCEGKHYIVHEADSVSFSGYCYSIAI